VTTYTVVNARGRTVLPASDAATAALYRRIFDDKHGQGSHRVVAAGSEVRAPVMAKSPDARKEASHEAVKSEAPG
jgi:hypothetical protein